MKYSSLIFALFFILSGVFCADIIAYTGYYSFPDIRDGYIVFNSQDNLWLVEETGGKAKRITSNPVQRAMGKISPSGEYIAYSASVDGKHNVFVMDIKGGIPRKLTHHPGNDQVLGWTRDSRYIIFRSSRQQANYDNNIFKISIEGGYPELINIGTASLISFADDEDFIAFNTTSREFRTWKRYKGGTNMSIWAGRISRQDFEKITTFRGDDAFPMIYNDRIYFVSNRRGRSNIFSMTYEGTDLEQHTDFQDFDIGFPSLGDNGRIAFQMAGDIYIYDIKSDTAEKISIEIPSENMSGKPRYIDAGPWIRAFELSPDSRTAIFEARGNLFLVPVKEGRTRTIAQDSSFRIKFPTYSNDGSRIAFFSDETGSEQLYYSDLSDNAERVPLTDNLKGWHYSPVWSPLDDKIMFSDEKFALYYYDLQTKRITLVDKSENNEIRNYTWSPDGRFIAYSKVEPNTFSSIFVYDINSKKIHRITDSATNDHNPAWDPKGKYLFFLSARQFSPMIGNLDFQTIMTQMDRPYIVLLNKEIVNPLKAVEPEDQEEEFSFRLPGHQRPDSREEKVSVQINFDNIIQRTFPLPVPSGNYSQLKAVQDKIFFSSSPDWKMNPDRQFMGSRRNVFDIISFDLKKREHSEFAKGVSGFHISAENDRMMYRINDRYRVVRLEYPSFDRFGQTGDFSDMMSGMGRPGGRSMDEFVDISNINLIVHPQKEWEQIFDEAVRLQDLLYWASDLANVDWSLYAQRYKSLLPRISTRSELNFLIGELIGELATGHTYIFGGDPGHHRDIIPTGLLGIDLETEGDYYKIKRIISGDIFYRESFSPLTAHPEIEENHYIMQINGVPIRTNDNIYRHLDNLAGREILLSVSKDTDPDNAKDFKIKTLYDESYLRYIDWVNNNRSYVEKATGGKIGYIHIPDMSARGMVEFNKQYYNQLDKEGLIIDVRYNGGGFVSQLIIERLRRELIFLDYMRHSSHRSTYPRRTFLGHMVCLINESAGSDGDIFPEAFKKLGLGPLIGTTTWGGVIGIRMDKPFVDGGLMSIPEYAHYDPVDGWTMENIGVDPDIEVVNKPQDIALGKDPQLDKGIEILINKIKDFPIEEPKIKPYPDKSIEAWIKYWEEIGVDTP